jgi:hypothetical protein
MTSRLLRIRRLEKQLKLAQPAVCRYGWIKPLPKDYVGERHVVMIKREPSRSPNIEWCEFEERAGAASTASDQTMTMGRTL